MTRKLGVLLLLLGGCASPCEKLNDAIVSKYEECGIELSSDLEDGGSGDCAIEADEADCTGACYSDADCAALDGTDPDAALTFADCLVGCEPAA